MTTAPASDPRPERPEEGECCRGDCGSSCVFELYEQALERWKARQPESPATGADD